MIRTFFVCICIFFSVSLFGQEQSAISKLLHSPKLKNIPLDQDLFLHLNQTRFCPGDTIWFRGYALQGPFQQSSALSSSLTVALIDENKQDIRSTQFMMFEGKAEGQIILPETQPSGYYQLVAYTSNMLNFDWEHFFRIPIEIFQKRPSEYNLTYSLDKPGYSLGDTVELQLHNFDNNLQAVSKGKLRYTYFQNGKGIETSKLQVDESGNTSVRFPYAVEKNSSDSEIIQFKVNNTLAEEQDAGLIYIPSKSSLCDIQILPEGGEFIENLQQTIAFRAVDQWGVPIDVSGIVENDKGEEVVSFSSMFDGMGKFILIANEGRSYKMKITSPEKYVQTIEFPKARKKGVVLSLKGIDQGYAFFRIQPPSNELINITGVFQMDGIILAETNFELAGDRTVQLSVKDLPTGIAKYTLFDKNGQAINERLIFVEGTNKNRVRIDLKEDKFASRTKVTVGLLADNSVEELNKTDLSMSVTHIQTGVNSLFALPDIREYSIFKPEFNSRVYKVEQYFDESLKKGKLVFIRDLLMLTHGWRTFPWYENLKEKADTNYILSNYDRYVGRVTKGKKPVPNAKLNVFPFPNSTEIMNFKADEEGRFSFLAQFEAKANPTLVFHAERKSKLSRTNLQINDRERDMRDTIITAFAEEIIPLNYTRNTTEVRHEEEDNSIFKLWDTEFIEEVTVSAEREIDETEDFLTQNGFGFGLSRTFNPANYDDYALSMDNIIYNLGAGLYVENDTLYKNKYGSKVAIPIYLDEMPISSDYFQISHLTSDMIQRVTFAEGQGFLSGSVDDDYSAGVLLVWINKNAKDKSSVLNRNAYVTKRYEDSRIFYKPKYETKLEQMLPIQDERITLHWENNIQLDSLGNAAVSFYTGDLKGEYLINVQGVTSKNGVVFDKKIIQVY